MLLMLLVASIAIPSKIYAQSCPDNIGFENGNFQNWSIYVGTATADGDKNVVSTAEIKSPIVGRHTIISDKSLVDPYGKFPIVPKNGGNFAVKLGNNGTGGQAEGVSYLLTVPADRPEFTLTYQYAVVLEDPNHLHEEQPRFIARVKDLEKNEYISCASFEYISVSGLPGFKQTNTTPAVIYKDWSPVTINLSGYQGKKLLIEFISADCTLGGHFGYAYIDVNNICADLITGNTYCKSADEINVSGPSGFQSYNWYNADRSVRYGTGQAITIKPTPAEGSKILLELVPFTGFGCPSVVAAYIQSVDYQLQVKPQITVCENAEIDLTSTNYISNKSAEFTYLIFEDKDLTQPIIGLVKVKANKTYYIKATNYKGCESFGSIEVSLFDIANITAKNPSPACYTETVDITADDLYNGHLEGVTRTYFLDANTTAEIADPRKIETSGKYYTKLTNETGCSKVLPIEVIINQKPLLKINNPVAACYPSTIDMTSANIFTGSDSDLSYEYYSDETLTTKLSSPENISKTGTYYIKATNKLGCVVSGKISVTINELPTLIVKNPEAVCYPERVDITSDSLYAGSTPGLTFAYFSDEKLTAQVATPKAIAKAGTYFVKATNSSGCSVSEKVSVSINSLPKIVINKPRPIFDSEFVDLTSADITKGSSDFVKASYYEDALLRKPVADPTRVNSAGTYYILLANERGCSVTASVELDILPQPKIIVPSAFTPQKETNNRLFPFLVSIQKLISFKVFNKWGILVYQTDALANGGWDGQFRSKMQPLETFSWYAEGIDAFGGKYQSTGKTILIL